MTKEQENAITVLYHLAHINTYLDLYSEKEVKLDTKTIKEWKNATTLVLDLIQQLQTENEEKDKQIDEMAKFIEVFELDKEIAETYCDGTYENCKHKEDIGTCKSCIKQYFKKKAQEIN